MPADLPSRRPRALPSLPSRVRFLKLLRAHGVRGLERMRASELREALMELSMPPIDRRADDALPSSSRVALSDLPPLGDQTPPDLDDEDFDEPHALPRFREPRVFLPDSRETFLRLIAVDAQHLFLTWDLTPADRERIGSDHTRVEVYGPGDTRLVSETIDVRSGGWYLPAPDDGLALTAALFGADDALIARSNPCVVPPAREAAAGPLRYATLPFDTDRRQLGKGALWGADTGEPREMPEGVLVIDEGQVSAPDRDMSDEELEAYARGLPFSASLSQSRLRYTEEMPASGLFSATLVRGAGQ